jgi:serine/threonine-protein kinase
MDLVPGMLVGPNVRLVRMLARGGMGSVWVADHLALKTQVAVKFIDQSLGDEDVLLLRFEREATSAAQIRSPHVVQIFDHGFVDGKVPYIIMELLQGESLGSRLDRLGPLPLDEASAIIAQTCKALSRAHAHGIVHRDIKPDNIFLTDSEGDLFVKVLDFGIAKQQGNEASGMTLTGTTVGTPHYMSPEQLLSAKDVGVSADLWAVAAVAYRVLTGRPAFDGETFAALCIAIHHGVYLPVRDIRPELPEALDGWFRQALQNDPAARFASARELAESFALAAGFRALAPSVPSRVPALANALPTTRTASISPAPRLRLPRSVPPVVRDGGGASLGGAIVASRRQKDRLARRAGLVGATVGVLIVGGILAVIETSRPATNPPPSSTGPSAHGAASADSAPSVSATAVERGPNHESESDTQGRQPLGGGAAAAAHAESAGPPFPAPLQYGTVSPLAPSTKRLPPAGSARGTSRATKRDASPEVPPTRPEIDHGF